MINTKVWDSVFAAVKRPEKIEYIVINVLLDRDPDVGKKKVVMRISV